MGTYDEYEEMREKGYSLCRQCHENRYRFWYREVEVEVYAKMKFVRM